MRIPKYMAGAALAAMAIFACDNDSLNIGNTLTDESDQLYLEAQDFDVQTRTMVSGPVLALSADCFLGRVKDPETGADVSSQFTSQFHMIETIYFLPEDSIATGQDGRAIADSCVIQLGFDSPFIKADSLLAMKLKVSELDQPMEEGRRYYSDFDPRTQGLLRTDGFSQTAMFSYRNLNTTYNADVNANNIRIVLSNEYTDKQGNTYNNYGSYIMRQYFDHPEYFKSSYAFAHNVCPGFFFEITDGYGFHARVNTVMLTTFYHVKSDSTAAKNYPIAGTKEVLQTTYINNNEAAVNSMAQESGYTYLKTPAGLFTEVIIPVDEIKNAAHANDSIIGAKLTLQRINNQKSDIRLLGTPKTLLLLQRDSIESFFESSQLPNNKTSFYTSFGGTSPNCYTFTNISNIVTQLWNMKQKGLATDPDWLSKHPNWNHLVLVPISYTMYSTTISNVQHDMSLCSTRLVGGTANGQSPVKINVVYANFK